MYNMRYASFFNLAYPELELDNPLSRMHCIHYASSLQGKLGDKMTGRFNQDLPEHLQTAFKKDIRKHCKTCATCQLHKLENVKFERKIFKPSLQPMDFICMDLIGKFQPPDKLWTPLCIDSCLYAYRVYMVCTLENKDSGRGLKSIYGPHLQ